MTIFTQSHLEAHLPLNDVNIFQCQVPHVARPQRCFHTFFWVFFAPRFWRCVWECHSARSRCFCFVFFCYVSASGNMYVYIYIYIYIYIYSIYIYIHTHTHFFLALAHWIYIYIIFIYTSYIYILELYIYMVMSVEVRRLQRGFLGFRGGLWMYHFPPGQIMMTGPSLKLHPPCIDHCQESIYRLLKW